MNDAVQRLLTVSDQARKLRDDAQRALQQAEQQCTQARSQGHMLHSYRADTAVRWTRPAGKPTDVIQMGTAHNFLARLDTALQQHELNLQQAQMLTQRRRAELLAAETRLAALTKVVERRQRQALAQAERSEQVANDQLAQRRPANDPNTDPHCQQSSDATFEAEPADTPSPSAPPQEPQPCPH